MRLKPRKIQISRDEPFENDLLNRKEFIENLLNLLKLSDDSIILALTGKYGIGKTTLLKMLCYHANNSGFETVYFNAWESDYIDDPFSSILTEITNLIPEKSDIRKQVIDAGINILKIGVPAIIKAATMNIVDLSEASEEAISKITSELASIELEKHLKYKNNIDTFKIKLAKAIKVINEEDKEVIIVIDELDRCKPTYSVKLLESIKHIFDIENIHFIIGLDYSQLSESIFHIYGRNTDSNGYLRRFFDFQVELSSPNIKDYINFLFTSYGLNEKLNERTKIRGNEHDQFYFSNVLLIFAKYNNASLRDIEKCFNIFSYVLSATETGFFIFPAVLAFIIIQYLFDKDYYKKIINYELSDEEKIKYFYNNRNIVEIFNEDRAIHLEDFVAQLYVTSQKKEDQSGAYYYLDKVINDSTVDEKYIKFLTRVKEVAQGYRSGRNFGNVMEYIEKKIQFIDTLKIKST